MNQVLEKVRQTFVSPSLGSLWLWSAGHRLQLLELCAGEMFSALLGLAFTVATKNIIDSAVAASLPRIRLWAAILVGVILLQLLTHLFLRYTNVRITATFRQQMRSTMIEQVLGKQYSELVDIHSGELVGKLLTDTSTVTSAIVQIVPSLLFLGTQFLGAAIILLRYSPLFVCLLIGFCLIGAACMAVMGRFIKRFHKETRQREDQVLSSVQETMQNLRIIKASEIEDQAREKIWASQTAFVKAELKKARFSAITNMGIGFIFRFTWLFAMLWGCYGIYSGAISYGMLTAMLQLVGQIQNPISSLTGEMSQLYGAVSSAERLDELLSKQDEERFISGRDPQSLYDSLEEIQVRSLSFSYDRDTVIDNQSYTVKPGDITAITGHSGCGKSTFFLLLMGLYQPQGGEISFAFRDGQRIPAGRETRRMFAYVPQGNALFSGSIRDNVSLFRKGAPDDAIWHALELACISDFVQSLDTGLDTLLGERGLGLSEGQAQRIALARAFLSDAPILLLDEATSALDEKTEATLLANIASLQDKTCLVVTHRPAALKICTQRWDFENK